MEELVLEQPQQSEFGSPVGLSSDLSSDLSLDLPLGLPEGITMPPTEDELPYDDGVPMESAKHRLQMELLIEPLDSHYVRTGRRDVAVHGNMGVYYSIEQARKQNFRAPDFFVVLGANDVQRLRKSWVIWQEERAPNLVIELLSESTKEADRGIKKQIYQDAMRVPEYILHDVVNNEFEAFRLTPPHNGNPLPHYEAIPLTSARFQSRQLGLELVLWEGDFHAYWDTWLRWSDPATGEVLPTSAELARKEAKTAARERERGDRLAEKLRALGINPDEA